MLADFRAIYHVGWTEAMNLPGPEFLTLASRLPNYPGVMRTRAEREYEEQQKNERRNVRNPEARLVDLNDPALAGLIQIG